MEKNIENNTENKFGNFLNFMKKFLAMSFFCAIAAFGFGALNARAEISKDVANNYTDVTDKYSATNQPISSINKTDTATLEKYTEKEGVLYYVDGGATAYALKRKDPGNIETPADGKLEISANDEIMFNASTKEKVTKIHTKLIDDGVTDLTIKGYDGNVTPVTNDNSGNVVAISDSTKVTNKLKSLTVKTSDGKGVGANKLAVAQTAFKSVVKDEDNITTPHNYKISKNSVTIDESKAGKDDKILDELGNKIKVTDSDDKEIKGNWTELKSITGTSKYNATFKPTANDLEPEIFEITITTGTPAKAEKTDATVEYEAGKTTWGELLAKVQVNTSKDKGATGTWSVQAGNLGGPVIKYSGTGSLESVKMESELTEAVLTYTAGENDAFADSSSSITIKLTDISKNLEEKFGKQTTFGDYTFYVNEKTGETSTILSKNGASLLREESHGTAAWYGFDNSEGALPEGSVVSVKWYGKEDAGYSEKLEKATKGIQSLGIVAEDDKVWVFELNAYKKVTDDNGAVDYEKVSNFGGKTLKVYIELGDDWNMNDVSAIYIDENNKVTTWNKFLDMEVKEINGVYRRFAVLKLKHFSPHIVYDEKTAKDIMDKLTQAGEEAKANYMKNLPEGAAAPTKDELDKIAADAITKAYEELSQEEKEQLEEYMKKMFGFEEAAPPADTNKDSSGTTDGNTSGTSNKSSGSNKSSSSTSSTTKTGKNETLSALLFLLCSGGTLSLNLAMRKKYFNA
ncbi:MAG: hypothetical protein IJQ10_03255 [Clostridia bacterium]|nr:hypothetical protein [Clostridia bacterium]